jgi:hypothetical protein
VYVTPNKNVCATPKNNWSPPSQVLCSAIGVDQRGPITPLPHPNGMHRSQEESSDGGGSASFHDLCCSQHRAPGKPQTPAQTPQAPVPGAAAHRRKRNEMLTHIPAVAANAPGASSIHDACAPVASNRSSSLRSLRRYEQRMRSVQNSPRRRPLRTWRSIRTRRFVPSTQSRSTVRTRSCTRRPSSATTTSSERSSKRWLRGFRTSGNPSR